MNENSKQENNSSSSTENFNRKGFEESIKELERIVAELERGNPSLENQLKNFERGVALSKQCAMQLEEIEKKVEILVQSMDGTLSTKPFLNEA